jgi:radical SAM protein with 4Fe4S-binding SPASM domain
MYRRVAIERGRAQGHPQGRAHAHGDFAHGANANGANAEGANAEGANGVTFRGAGFQYADGLNRPVKGVNDGRGFLFVSHIGDIMPSGFLPLPVDNVRQADVVDVYRNHPTFKALRDPQLLKGKCGRCEYARLCGGQRGRAYALTGDYLESDPACVYDPPEKGTQHA